jgi:dihydroxy-acid dehydratase
MRASLMSRDCIADSAELAVRGHCLDAVLFLVGCDKTLPGAAMAAARLNLPSVVLYGGSIMPGKRGDKPSPSKTCLRPWAPARRARSRRRTRRDRESRLPRRRRLRRPVHRQHHGAGAQHAGPVAHGIQRCSRRRSRQARNRCRRPAASWMAALERNPSPRDLITPLALKNAAAAVTATAGSTNAVLHLLAIAREAGISQGRVRHRSCSTRSAAKRL